jgi:Protein of unknown function (DUF3703)
VAEAPVPPLKKSTTGFQPGFSARSPTAVTVLAWPALVTATRHRLEELPMTDHTFAVPGLTTGGAQYVRAVSDAAFAVDGVHAVGIDRAGGTLTVTSGHPVAVAELAAAIDDVGVERRTRADAAADGEAPTSPPSAPARTDLAAAWSVERSAARAARARGDAAAEWRHLERAHILSQPKAVLHVRTHVAMLAAGIRRHDRREVLGQLLRLVVAGPGSLTGRYPVGNTGGADVNALTPMPIPDDLAPYLPAVTDIKEQP